MSIERHPWLVGTLHIPQAVLDDVDAHALACYPEESCGFLVGPAADGSRVSRSIRAVNVANKYHKADPETFPRTAAMFYIIDAKVIYDTFNASEKTGEPVKVIYHSHCDAGAYFSSEDRAAAAPDGALSYPVLFLVTSVREGRVDGRAVFAFRQGQWVEAAWSVA